MPTLPDSVVHLLASVDYRRRLALVAENDSGPRGEVVGLGDFCAVDDQSVELGLVVRDDWQGQRVGTELVSRLLQAAEARGFHRFIAYVTADNVAIRRLLRSVCHVKSAHVSGAVFELILQRRAIPGPRPAAAEALLTN